MSEGLATAPERIRLGGSKNNPSYACTDDLCSAEHYAEYLRVDLHQREIEHLRAALKTARTVVYACGKDTWAPELAIIDAALTPKEGE